MKKQNVKKQNVALVLLGVLGVSGSAMAAVDAAVTTAISSAQTDGSTIASGVLAAVIVISMFKIMRRAV